MSPWKKRHIFIDLKHCFDAVAKAIYKWINDFALGCLNLTRDCHFSNLRHLCGDSFHALRSPGVSEVEMKIYERSLQALLSSAPCSRVLARLASLVQIGELARRLFASVFNHRPCPKVHSSSVHDFMMHSFIVRKASLEGYLFQASGVSKDS